MDIIVNIAMHIYIDHLIYIYKKLHYLFHRKIKSNIYQPNSINVVMTTSSALNK